MACSLSCCGQCFFGTFASIIFLFAALLAAAIMFDEDLGSEVVEDKFVPEIVPFLEVNQIANFGIRTTNTLAGVTVETITSVPSIPTNRASSPSVLFKIIGSQMDVKIERPNFELCIILDNSGSMSGNKLEYSKQTIKSILTNLAPQDIVHLVTYSDNSKVVFTSISGEAAPAQIPAVEAIRPEGSTNMYSGLSQAKTILQSSKSDNTKRIFLFSDGLVNVGVVDHAQINKFVESLFTESGITTASFGLGSGFDEVLMSSIAVAGKGDFNFIDQPEKIPDLVSHALKGLASLVCLNMVLRAEGNQVLGDERSPIQLGDLRRGETKTQLIELSSYGTESQSNQLLFTYSLEFFDQVSKERKKIQGKIEVGSTQSPHSGKDTEVAKHERLRYVMKQDKVASNYLYQQKYSAAVAITQNNINVLNAAPAHERDLQWSTQMERERVLLNSIAFQKDYNTAKKKYSYYGSISGSSYYSGHS